MQGREDQANKAGCSVPRIIRRLWGELQNVFSGIRLRPLGAARFSRAGEQNPIRGTWVLGVGNEAGQIEEGDAGCPGPQLAEATGSRERIWTNPS